MVFRITAFRLVNKGYVKINEYKEVEKDNKNVGPKGTNQKLNCSLSDNSVKHVTISEFTKEKKI